MAPQEDALAVGDVVEVVNMPDSSGMNGITGTLLKTVGKGRWAIKVDGDDRSKVVSVENLQKQALQPKKAGSSAAPRSYSIVGTWDDWEPSEMSWNAECECFEYRVIMGDSGSESFKILLNADWDTCVYPDRKDASAHVEHTLHGPDDGGLDEEWTIGLDEKDTSDEGACYKVRLYVTPDGQPKRVGWEVLRKEGGKPPVQQPAETRNHEPAAALGAVRPQESSLRRDFEESSSRRAFEDSSRRWEPPATTSPFYADHLEESAGGGGQRAEQVAGEEARRAGEAIVRKEREARERLARRLEEASDFNMQAIEDGSTGADADEKMDKVAVMMYSMAMQEMSQQYQVEVNRERYRAEALMNTAPPRWELVVRKDPQAEERPELTDEMEAQGWDPSVMCDGLTAGRRVDDLVDDGSLSRPMAVKYVMKKFASAFEA